MTPRRGPGANRAALVRLPMLAPGLVLAASCTAQARYEANIADRLRQCERLVSEPAREDCRARYAVSWEEYRQLRDSLPPRPP